MMAPESFRTIEKPCTKGSGEVAAFRRASQSADTCALEFSSSASMACRVSSGVFSSNISRGVASLTGLTGSIRMRSVQGRADAADIAGRDARGLIAPTAANEGQQLRDLGIGEPPGETRHAQG